MKNSLPDLPMVCTGGCHCGAIHYTVTVRSLNTLKCNCSICTKKGFWHLIVPAQDFQLVAGHDTIRTYTFGTHLAKHHFCGICGVHSYYIPRSHPDGVDVNVHCLDIDPAIFGAATLFDGRNWEGHIQEIAGYDCSSNRKHR